MKIWNSGPVSSVPPTEIGGIVEIPPPVAKLKDRDAIYSFDTARAHQHTIPEIKLGVEAG